MYKVLVVDDNIAIREGLVVFIRWTDYGFEAPVCAPNGREALALLERGEFHLLITDVRMPIMDGIALLREVTLRRIPVHSVVISGYRDFEYAQAALEYRALRYLLKPINEEQLIQTVRRVREELDADAPAPGRLPEDPFDQMLGHIDQNPCLKLSLKELAAQYHFNPAYLGRLFLKRTGASFNDYLGMRRARLAARLLAECACPVSEIAAAVGYADADHFAAVFRRTYGMTPSEYRLDASEKR